MAYQFLHGNVDTHCAQFSISSGIGMCKMLNQKIVSIKCLSESRALYVNQVSILPSTYSKHILALGINRVCYCFKHHAVLVKVVVVSMYNRVKLYQYSFECTPACPIYLH